MAVSLSQEEDDSLPIKGPALEADVSDNPRQPSRSPHPYRRKGSHSASLPADSGDRSTRLHWPRTSSDSGTEADDESTGVLKGLPAAPLRPRKGLRSGRQVAGEEDQWFPVLRPWPSITRSTSRSSRRSSGEEAEVEATGLREQAKRKRRIGILQRLLETALLLSVGAVVLGQEDTRSVAWAWRKGARDVSVVVRMIADNPQSSWPILCLSLASTPPILSIEMDVFASRDYAPSLYLRASIPHRCFTRS